MVKSISSSIQGYYINQSKEMRYFLILLMGILFINTPLYAIYYYYKGNKIPIEVNNDSIVVYVASKFNSTIVDIEASTIALNSTNDKAIY